MSPDYMDRLAVYDAQQDAARTNLAAHDMFRDHIVPNWIAKNVQNRNIGLAIEPPPAPPLETVVADDGAVTHRQFADLQSPTLPPNVDTNLHGFPVATDIPADRIDNMQKVLDRQTAMILILNGKLDRLLAR